MDASGWLRPAIGLVLLAAWGRGVAAGAAAVTLIPEVLLLAPFGSGVLTVTIDAPASAATIVTLTADPVGTLNVPTSTVIPTGATSALVSVTAVTAEGSAVVTAQLGESSASADVIVGDPPPPSACAEAVGAAGATGSAYASQVPQVASACLEPGVACNNAISGASAALRVLARAHRVMKTVCRPSRP
jgi:hypothetical protein